jgi:tetratricopeptide repeat protein
MQRLGLPVTGCLSLLPISFSLLSSPAPPVAGQVLNVAGRVEIQRAGQPVQKGTLLFQLRRGDLLKVQEGGSAEVVLFQNGARYRLSGAATARVELADLKAASGTAPHPLHSLSPTFTRRMQTGSRPVSPRFLGVLVRDPGDPTQGPRNPSPNGALPAPPVTLRWDGPIGGDSLRVQISDGEQTIHRAELPPTERAYQVPNGILRPGQYYVWSVTTLHGGDAGARCRALLRILAPDEQKELNRLKQETAAARAAAPDNPASLLLLAQAYERFGLFDAARTTYQEVLRVRPEEPGVRAALQQLRAAPGGAGSPAP